MLVRLEHSLARGRARLTFQDTGATFHIRPIADSACRVACPAEVNVKAYVGLIAAGMFDRALEVVRERNPLPGICGRVCTHPCESECRRKEIDEPVAIRPLKRFIADYALQAAQDRPSPRPTIKSALRVAVIGSGPAGLTCASDLARLGYQVTIFEALSRPGGMLRYGIPEFRLPRPIIDQEIDEILRLGIALETNAPINSPKELLENGYAAVFWATGAHRPLRLGIGEEGIAGVLDSLGFLREVAQGKRSELRGSVLVIGGGNSAIDSARTAVRLGATKVQIIYRRTRREMPADPDEVTDAEKEGITILEKAQPVAILSRNGRLSGVRCIRTRLAEQDESGRRRPVPVPGSEFEIAASVLISAVGQRPETCPDLVHSPAGTVAIDPATSQTSLPRVFAGGDVVTGPATVIDAIAAGHRAARSIHAFLTAGREPTTAGCSPSLCQLEITTSQLTAVPMGRATIHKLPARRRKNFTEVEQPLTTEEAIAEAQRCLRCGPCLECVRCHTSCPRKLLALFIPRATGELLLRVLSSDLSEASAGPATRKVELTTEKGPSLSLFAVPVLYEVLPELCRGCGRCADTCHHRAIVMTDWQPGLKTARVDPSLCRGCGNCVATCPSGAIRRSQERVLRD
ncbi:MAG: FAD-dependent oxidoreductase [candidate division WOR-3 bacterium]